MLYGLITLLLMLVFIGIVAWAWSARRRKTYEEAARMPLEDDHPATSHSGARSSIDETGTTDKERRP